ncbi:MAG: hypothetical protein OEL53_07365 [Rhodospirillales bacterium]|nr:hypothetical protein [Rhodospirillales bacterium]
MRKKVIKLAEQSSNKVVFPSIKELRYSGRRIVDALSLIIKGGKDEDIVALFEDAKFCCYRARHDAIDVAASVISVEIEEAIKELGHKALFAGFSDFSQLWAKVRNIREKIAASRKDRANRDAIYKSIEAVDLESLIQQFNDFKSADPLIREYVRKEEENELKLEQMARRGIAIGVIGGAFGLIGIVVSVLLWLYPLS